jgi:hypothetical protein
MSAAGPETASESDHSGVRVPLPLLYTAGFVVAAGLQTAWPIDAPPVWLRVAGATAGAVLWLALDGVAMLFFRRALHEHDPVCADRGPGNEWAVQVHAKPHVSRHGLLVHRRPTRGGPGLGTGRATTRHRCR